MKKLSHKVESGNKFVHDQRKAMQQQPMVAAKASPMVGLNKSPQSVTPMDDSPRVRKSLLEETEWQVRRGLTAALSFCKEQPVIAVLILVLLWYLVSINRKVSRLERSISELM